MQGGWCREVGVGEGGVGEGRSGSDGLGRTAHGGLVWGGRHGGMVGLGRMVWALAAECGAGSVREWEGLKSG